MNKTKLSVIFDMPANSLASMRQVQNDISKNFDNVTILEEEFHMTLAVADDLPENEIGEIRLKLKQLLDGVSFNLELGPVQDLVNHKQQGVVYIKAYNKDVENLYKSVRKLLENYGGKFTFPDFKGHVTLAYLTDPVTKQQKEKLKQIQFDQVVKIEPENLKISVKENDEWVRIGRLSKRLVSFRESQ